MRAGELHVEYKRFDDDTRTALNGGHVWTALVADGRATQPGSLGADYLATLLDTFDRALTPREIVQAFYKNPGFPLVTSTDEIRRVLYALITGDWELVDADGDPLAVAGPGQIAITSINQTVRHRAPKPGHSPEPTPGGGGPLPGGGGPLPGGSGQLPGADGQLPGGGTEGDGGDQPGGTQPGPTFYKRYRVQLTNKSITSGEAREQAWQLLQELRKVIDPANPADHQLLTLDLTLVTAEGQQGAIEAKAEALGAQVVVEDDDF